MTIKFFGKMIVRLMGLALLTGSAWLVPVVCRHKAYIVFPFLFLIGCGGLSLLISGRLDS